MVATVNIGRRIWPLSWFDRWRSVPAYGTSLGVMLDTAERYAETIGDEVAAARGGSPGRRRALVSLGHVLGWSGLALSLLGLFTAQRPEIEALLFGPFGVGLLMQVPSGALVRAGRRQFRPATHEAQAVDKRRPVMVLRAAGGADPVALIPALERYGPVIDIGRAGDIQPSFGEVDAQAALARTMDQSVLLVVVPDTPGDATADAGALGWQLDTIAKRRHGHKCLILTPGGDAQRWTVLRNLLVQVPGFATLPSQPPDRLVGLHLAPEGLVQITGSAAPDAQEYARAVDAAIYAMKCRGKW